MHAEAQLDLVGPTRPSVTRVSGRGGVPPWIDEALSFSMHELSLSIVEPQHVQHEPHVLERRRHSHVFVFVMGEPVIPKFGDVDIS